MAQDPFFADELEKLASLRDRGVITEEEFQRQKARLLGPTRPVDDLTAGASGTEPGRDVTPPSIGLGSPTALSTVAELHDLQGELTVLIHLPLDAASQRLVGILEANGSVRVTSSGPSQAAGTGKWRTAQGVKYELKISSVQAAPNTVVHFYSRKPDDLYRMLATQLVPWFNGEAGTAAPARFISFGLHKDVKVGFTNYDGGLPSHPRPERKGKLIIPQGSQREPGPVAMVIATLLTGGLFILLSPYGLRKLFNRRRVTWSAGDNPHFDLHWRHVPKGQPKVTREELARFSVEPRVNGRLCQLVIRDRVDPRVTAHLDLPTVSEEKFRRLLLTKIRANAVSWRPMYRIENFSGGLPAHPRPEASGVLTLVRSVWVLRFSGTDQLYFGRITNESITLEQTGSTACRVAIAVPTPVGARATFVIPDTSAATLRAVLDVRKEIGHGVPDSLTPAETKQILKATRLLQVLPSHSASHKKKAPAGWLAAAIIVAAGIGIAIASTSIKSSSPPITNAGVTDNCRAGEGYLDVQTNTCYQGSGPNANNSAGNGRVANCSADHPYYNAGTDLCYSGVPTNQGQVVPGSNSTGAQNSPVASGSRGGSHPRCSWYSQPDGSGGEMDLPEPAGSCFLQIGADWHPSTAVIGGRSQSLCQVNGAFGVMPPSSIVNITALDIGADYPLGTDDYGHPLTGSAYVFSLNGGVLTISGSCGFDPIRTKNAWPLTPGVNYR